MKLREERCAVAIEGLISQGGGETEVEKALPDGGDELRVDGAHEGGALEHTEDDGAVVVTLGGAVVELRGPGDGWEPDEEVDEDDSSWHPKP